MCFTITSIRSSIRLNRLSTKSNLSSTKSRRFKDQVVEAEALAMVDQEVVAEVVEVGVVSQDFLVDQSFVLAFPASLAVALGAVVSSSSCHTP